MLFITVSWLRPGNGNQSVWGDEMQDAVTNGKANCSAFAAKALVIISKTRLAYSMFVSQSSQQIALSSRYFKFFCIPSQKKG